MTTTEQILDERGKRYGKFTGHAFLTQELKRVMKLCKNWGEMQDDQREALEMIAHKIGRILNGDPNYDDSWADIAGYAQLVANRLSGNKKQEEEMETRLSITGDGLYAQIHAASRKD